MSRREECSHSVYFAQQMAGWCWESRDREIPKSAHHFVLYLIAGFNFYLRRFWVVFVAQLVERSILTPVVRNPIIGKFLCRTFVYCQTVLYQKGTNTEKEARNGPFLKKRFFFAFLLFIFVFPSFGIRSTRPRTDPGRDQVCARADVSRLFKTGLNSGLHFILFFASNCAQSFYSPNPIVIGQKACILVGLMHFWLTI